MSKTKHQGDPFVMNESSDSGDENCNTSDCSHISRAVDLCQVKKCISKMGFCTSCPDCSKQTIDDTNDLVIDVDESVWLCLKCGKQGCGRAKCAHALRHFETPHSDSHALCINTTHWSIWCYKCDNSVNAPAKNRKKKLWDTVDYLKRQKDGKSNHNHFAPHNLLDKTIDVALTLPTDITNNAANDTSAYLNSSGGLPRARGLTNLGNTCFFNSVMQCLGQTPYLLELLLETKTAGQHFKLPGGKLNLVNKDEIDVPPLEGATEKWQPLMQILAETLSELRSGRCEVFNPRALLNRLVSRMPQFGSGEQHDSHELLRHLLEAVREEDQKRYKSVILSKLGYHNKTDPRTVDDDKKKIVKFYGQQVSEMLLVTEQVFRGVLVSTLQCQVCNHVSHREEKFLDLSLPIFERQASHILRRKAEYIEEDNKSSKYQIKKEKRTVRRNNKKQKHNNKENQQNLFIDAPPTITLSDVSMDNKSESDESDADVEDNVEDNNLNIACQVIPLPAPGEEFPLKCESGYNSDKLDNCSPDSNADVLNTSTEVCVDDSGVPSPVAAPMNEMLPNSPESSPSSSELNIEMNHVVISSIEEDFNDGRTERPVSRLEFTENNNKNTDLKADLEKLSLLNDGDSNKVDLLDNNLAKPQEEPQLMVTDDVACALESTEMMDQNEDVKYSGTLAPRYYNDDGECSVESCLNQFTECELLMGVNRVGCDSCTKRSGTNKTVYTDVSKQLLISNPPAVLILHLKRFQVFRFRSTKVSKFVKFSTILDIAPFCSNQIHNLPNFDPLQNKVLYSLYGVVEHSGSIHGGHYVAYVKVRTRLEENSPRWNFIPKNQQQNINTFIEMNSNQMTEDQPTGKWYYISDSHVAEVAESKVLSAQAYLLFYERFM